MSRLDMIDAAIAQQKKEYKTVRSQMQKNLDEIRSLEKKADKEAKGKKS